MKKLLKTNQMCFLALVVTLLFTFNSCSTEELTSSNEELKINNPTLDLQENMRGAVIHHVSLGGNDACVALGQQAGCDANFSLVANMHADGSVKGQWIDTFTGGGLGVHVDIDCMVINGNTAVLGGYVKHGNDGTIDLTGLYAVTAVSDNGTSNNDPADQISYSYFGQTPSCDLYDISLFPLLDLARGQVKVW